MVVASAIGRVEIVQAMDLLRRGGSALEAVEAVARAFGTESGARHVYQTDEIAEPVEAERVRMQDA